VAKPTHHRSQDDDDGDKHTHRDELQNGRSFFTKTAAVVTALGAAAATLAAGRAALPALLARRAGWARGQAVPLAGLGAFDDDGGFDVADPLDASGFMEMGGVSSKRGGGGGGAGGDGDGGPGGSGAGGLVDLKVRAGGVPVGPVIDAATGGIGAYRPPSAPAADEEAGGGEVPPLAPPGDAGDEPPLI
jgi:hypothetical protein